MEKTTSYKQLLVWQKAHTFVLEIYNASQRFPSSELYALPVNFAGLLFQLQQTLLKDTENRKCRQIAIFKYRARFIERMQLLFDINK